MYPVIVIVWFLSVGLFCGGIFLDMSGRGHTRLCALAYGGGTAWTVAAVIMLAVDLVMGS